MEPLYYRMLAVLEAIYSTQPWSKKATTIYYSINLRLVLMLILVRSHSITHSKEPSDKDLKLAEYVTRIWWVAPNFHNSSNSLHLKLLASFNSSSTPESTVDWQVRQLQQLETMAWALVVDYTSDIKLSQAPQLLLLTCAYCQTREMSSSLSVT